MKPTLLAGVIGILVVGTGPAALMAQHKAPLQQPNSEAAAMVPAGELALGSVRVPKGLKADGKELPAGTYRVRLTPEEAAGKAPGATAAYERYVEFVQGTQVKGREVVALELNAIQRPSLLITGRVFVISTLMLLKIGAAAVLKSKLFVSVIW